MEQQIMLFEGVSEEQRRAAALHFEILAAVESHINTALDLGRKLKQMRDSGGYRALGFESFEGYARAAAGMGQRQAYNYILIAEKVPERLAAQNAEAGVTKLALLAQLGPRDQEEVAGEGQLAGITVAELQELINQKNGLAEQLTMLQDMQRMGRPVAEAESAEVDIEAIRREAAGQALAEAAAQREDAIREAAEKARRDAWEEAKAQAEQMQQRAEAEARQTAAAEADRRIKEERKKAADELKRKLEEAGKKAADERSAAVEAAKQAGIAQGEAKAGALARQAEQARQEALARAEALQKQLEVAGDSETTKFLVLFDQLQATYRQMAGVLEELQTAGKGEKADKLRGALGKALAAMMG